MEIAYLRSQGTVIPEVTRYPTVDQEELKIVGFARTRLAATQRTNDQLKTVRHFGVDRCGPVRRRLLPLVMRPARRAVAYLDIDPSCPPEGRYRRRLSVVPINDERPSSASDAPRRRRRGTVVFEYRVAECSHRCARSSKSMSARANAAVIGERNSGNSSGSLARPTGCWCPGCREQQEPAPAFSFPPRGNRNEPE